jgi:hypothetical protein
MNVANAGQADFDRDRLGDACDPDDDNDGVADGADQCPDTGPETLVGADGCVDRDRDDDGVTDDADNCGRDANPDQADQDFDGDGDVCDDVDGVPGGRVLARGTVKNKSGKSLRIWAMNACGPNGSVYIELPNGSTFRTSGPGTMRCYDHPGVTQSPATSSGFDVETGSAPGSIDDRFAATVDWTYLDRGSNSRDRIAFTVRTATGTITVPSQGPTAYNVKNPGTVFTQPPS